MATGRADPRTQEEGKRMTTQPRLLRDLIEIPTAVHKGDLVYQLADAADNAAETVAQYVVTDQLRAAFLDAVGLLRSAMADRSSKAAFLHGSFGSGKSNFMGVLQLLLDDNPAARAVPELAPVVANLDQWKGVRRFLTVPFHLIGESDLESAVFGQYVRHLQRIRPGAPPPAVFADEPILENADQLRGSVGDEAFFAKVSSGSVGEESGWGDLDAAWDAASYEGARQAAHGSPDRTRLVQAILTTWLTSFAEAAHANKGGYVSFEDGLSAISIHAQSLGYDGVILFLDELILWFLSRLGDMAWVSKEASKLSELVEAASATRPVPIVSIIARQRDLRELVGEDVPGAEKLSFADQLDYQAGRFDTITLDDSNLPLVANRRLLTPVDEAANAELDAAFASLSLSPRVHDVLLAEKGNDDAFRLTYPFSPAFMTVSLTWREPCSVPGRAFGCCSNCWWIAGTYSRSASWCPSATSTTSSTSAMTRSPTPCEPPSTGLASSTRSASARRCWQSTTWDLAMSPPRPLSTTIASSKRCCWQL